MIKRFSSILVIICGFVFTSNAQNQDSVDIKKGSIYLELGGNSFFYSFNYDYIVMRKGLTKLVIGSGFSYIPDYGGWNIFGNTLFISPNANLLIGKTHNLEIGSGLTFSLDDRFAIPVRIGYRYQPQKGGFLFRFGFTPLFSDFIYPLAGLSIGYTIE